MQAHHHAPPIGAARRPRGRYLAGVGAVALALAVVVGALGVPHAPARTSTAAAGPEAGAPASGASAPSALFASPAVQGSGDPSEAIYVVRSGRQALALWHSQPELMGMPRANVLVIGSGASAATAGQEIEAARESLGDATAPVIDLR